MRYIAGFCLVLFQFLPVSSMAEQDSAFFTDSKIIYDVCFSPNGEIIAIADKHSVKIYDFDERKLVNEFKGGHKDHVMAVEISGDSTMLVSGSKDGIVVVWDLISGDILTTFNNHNGIVTSISISSDSRYMSSGATDNVVILYDLSNLSVIEEFRAHEDDVMVVNFSPDGKMLASGGGDSNIYMYDVIDREIITKLKDHTDWVRDLAFDPDTAFLTSVGDDGIYFWSIADRDNMFKRRKTDNPGHWKTSISYMGQSRTYVISTIRGIIYVITPHSVSTKDLEIPVNKVINRPVKSIFFTIVAATRGKGVVVIPGKEFN